MSSKWLDVAKNGLSKNNAPRKKVLILGAGIAGLVAAYELLKAGHTPIILEAQNRLGGRILTLRAPFAEGLHAEAGAMRIPKTHDLTLYYIKHFGLELLPFTMGNPNAYVYIGGKKLRIQDYREHSEKLEHDLMDAERATTVQQMWSAAIQEFVDDVAKRGDAAWQEIVAKYDNYSTREFLEEKGWSEGAIELYGLMENQEANMNFSFVELLREDVGEFYTNMSQIKGGTDRLPYAFYSTLAPYIRLGATVTALDQNEASVTAHYKTLAGRFSETADYMICTLPFAVLRHLEILKPFTHAKQKAIRQLHYDASTKIFIQTRRRFWEEDENIFGGGTVTDLAIRNLYYPEHGRETGRGVLLASYTWADDAERWASLPPRERLEQAIENIAQIHPQIVTEYEGGASWSWHDDPHAGGAFAMFEPGQQTRLYADIIRPEGRVHFAGEHASLEHAWIQGSIESGLRAATEINEIES
ncbi:MAG: flavin monoamine oxidase family protein [Chloroflexota bacterium]|nr:MAG: flavin monoamine oxidase family protein [Chloroflexota bacterium]